MKLFKRDYKEVKRLFVYRYLHHVNNIKEVPVLIKLFECSITGKRKFYCDGFYYNSQYQICYFSEINSWLKCDITTQELYDIYLSKLEYGKEVK